MKKYPWDDEVEMDWSQDWQGILSQYQDRYFNAKDKLIGEYFRAERFKICCITGWSFAAILFYCLVAVSV